MSKRLLSSRGDRMAIAARNAAQEVVLDDLRDYAGELQTQAGNDLEKLLSSGFQATKTPTRLGTLVPLSEVRRVLQWHDGRVHSSVYKGSWRPQLRRSIGDVC